MHRKIISIHSHTFTVTSLAPSEDVGEGVVGRGHCLQVCLYLLLDSFLSLVCRWGTLGNISFASSHARNTTTKV